MRSKFILLSSAAIVLASFGTANAQAPSQNGYGINPPAANQIPAEKQKSASDLKKQEPSTSESLKSDDVKAADHNAVQSHSPRSTVGQGDAGDTKRNLRDTSEPGKAPEKSRSNESTAPKKQNSATDESQSSKSSGSTATDSTKSSGSAATESKEQMRNAQQRDGETNRAAAAATSHLNKEQEAKINSAIAATKVEPVAKVNFSLSIGTSVPGHVHLQPLPTTIVSIVPQYRGYEYFLVREEIIIVEPRTKKIVKIIKRSGPSHASSQSRSQKIKLSETDRNILRKSARHSRATTGANRSVTETITVGEPLPATVEIEAFPEEIYSEVPAIRDYRYYRTDRGLFLVDPADRVVIEEVD
jgi:hypothetical protein